MKINKKNIIQAFIVIVALVCIFGYVFVNNTKILKAEDVTSTEVTIYCHEYAAYTNEYEIVSTTHEGGEWTFNYKVKCICPTCGHEVWEEDRERSYSDTDYPTEEEAIAELESDLENYVRSESNTECNNVIGPMNFYIAAFQKNLYGFSENKYFISIKLDTNGLFELEENQGLRDKLYDLNIDITASSENGRWDDNYWWSSDVDANDPDNTMEYIAYLDYNDVYTFTLVNTNTGEELGSLIYTVDCILSPHDEALANHCTLTVDANLPDGFTTSDIKDNYGNSIDNQFGDFLVEKSENILSSGSDGISIAYTTEIDEYGNITGEHLGYYDGTSNDYEFLYNNSDKEYYFYGFNTNPDGTGENITELNITNDTTIYAIWKPYLYNLSYYEYNPYGVPYNWDEVNISDSLADYAIKYNNETFNPTEYWQDYDGISGSDFAEVGLDDNLNLPELTLPGYTFTGWDIVDPEYYYTRSYTDWFFKFIGKPNKLRNNWTYSEHTNNYYVSSTSQHITLIPHFEKTHEGNIKINLYVNSEKNNYTIFDDIVLDYNTLSDTADLPTTVETNGQTSSSLTIAIDNDNCNIDGDIPYDSNYSLFIEDHNGDHLVNLNLIEKVNNNDNVFGNDNLIQIKDNNNNSLAGYINRKEIVATPNGDQDMILNLYFDLYEYPQSYNIEYDLNDISDYYDVSIGVCPTSANVGSEVTIPKPTLKGYTFIGWKVNDTTQIINQNDGIYTNLGADEETVTLTAQWQPWTIDVAFAINLNLGGYYNTNNIYDYKYMSPLIPSNNSTYPYQMLTYNDGQGYAYKYGTVTIDVNKNISEYTDLLSEYNEISNMIVPGTEFNGFYVVPYANHLFDNKTYYDISYTNNIVIDDADNCILNNLPANYEITSSSLIYLIPKWDCNFYTKVNMHYAVQDENGNWEDYADAEEYYKYNTVERFVQSDTIPETPSAVLDNTNNIVSIYDSIYMNIPSSTLQNASSPYMNNIGVCIGNLFFVSDMNKSNRNVQVQLNNNYKNQSLSQFNYTLSLMYGGNTGNTFGYLESYNYTYGWSNTPATRNYTSIDYNRSSITFVDGNDDYNAIIDLYIKIPREKKELYVLFLSDTTNYPNIYYNDEKMYIDGERVLPPSSNNYNYQNTNSINLLNENNVSQTYNGYYFVNIHPIIYKGGSVTFSIETTSNYHITMAHGEPTSVNDFAEVNSMTLTWNDVSSSPWVYVRKMPHISTPFTINFDGTNTDINDVIYNGSHINKLVVDDETIWEKTCDVCGQAM